MIKYQDKIEVMREKDFKQFEVLKDKLKNLKFTSEDMDYEIIRLGKDRDRRKRNFRREIEDMEINIDGMKNWEQGKRGEINEVKKEIQK